MNIQNKNVNFGARRILNVRKPVKGGIDEVIDVFVLGREDKNFALRCLNTIQENRSFSITKNSGSQNLLGGDYTRGYKDFFRDFLIRIMNRKKHFVENFEDVHCFVAIKNGNTISGIAQVSDANFPTANLDRIIFPQKDKLAHNGLLYGILNEFRALANKEGQSALAQLNPKLSRWVHRDGVLNVRDIGFTQRSIRAQAPDIKYKDPKDPHFYDLEEFLDIKEDLANI